MIRRAMLIAVFLMTTMIGQAQEPNAHIIHMWESLNLRTIPDVTGTIVTKLAGRTPVYVSGRTRDNHWYQLQTLDGFSGWAVSGYVDLGTVDETSIPVILNPQADVFAPAPAVQQTVSNVVAASASVQGRVTAGTLNVRSAPAMIGGVLARLPMNSTVQLLGRSANNLWYQIRLADGSPGWVAAAYVQPGGSTVNLAVVDAIAGNAPQQAGVDNNETQPNPYLTVGANSWSIFASGQGLGNHPDVFSKVGDSITVASVMYTPIGYGAYNLGGYGYLQPTIEFFSRTPTRTGSNSFNTISLTANNGWTTAMVLDPNSANRQFCTYDESPIQCEYRLNRPSVALIMLGTNDIGLVPVDEFAHNLRVITEFSMTQGVIPVLSTIPPRYGYDDRVAFANQLIIEVAAQFGVPLWDFGAIMRTLPIGTSEDGVHPSIPPGGILNAANFTGDYLQYGYVMRNLSALQVLDTLRREVLQR